MDLEVLIDNFFDEDIFGYIQLPSVFYVCLPAILRKAFERREKCWLQGSCINSHKRVGRLQHCMEIL